MNQRLFIIPLLYFCVLETIGQHCAIVEIEHDQKNAFNVLDGCIKHAKVIGMGESTHGTHEFFTSRIAVFQYLVEQQHFNTFFLEADYANCLLIDEYIKGATGKVDSLTKAIALWPWITGEMIDLIEWMRAYNAMHQEQQLSFVGVDVQKIQETVTALIKLTSPNTPPSLLNLKGVTNNQFYRFNKHDIKKRFQQANEELAKLDSQKTNSDEISRLISQFNQIIACQISTNTTCRDEKMAKNILDYLHVHPEAKGFFWAHNLHIANFYNAKKNTGVAGGFLKKSIETGYYSIGQEFVEGSFNTYYRASSKTNSKTSEYTFGEVTVGPAAPGSFAHNFNAKYELPVYVPFEQLPESEEVYLTNIGATYMINNDPKSIWRYNHHGKQSFDAILLIKTSTPTRLLE